MVTRTSHKLQNQDLPLKSLSLYVALQRGEEQVHVYLLLIVNLVKSREKDTGESDEDPNTSHCLEDKNVIKTISVNKSNQTRKRRNFRIQKAKCVIKRNDCEVMYCGQSDGGIKTRSKDASFAAHSSPVEFDFQTFNVRRFKTRVKAKPPVNVAQERIVRCLDDAGAYNSLPCHPRRFAAEEQAEGAPSLRSTGAGAH